MSGCTVCANGLKSHMIHAHHGRKKVLSPIFYQKLHNAETLYESGYNSARHLCVYLGIFPFYGPKYYVILRLYQNRGLYRR